MTEQELEIELNRVKSIRFEKEKEIQQINLNKLYNKFKDCNYIVDKNLSLNHKKFIFSLVSGCNKYYDDEDFWIELTSQSWSYHMDNALIMLNCVKDDTLTIHEDYQNDFTIISEEQFNDYLKTWTNLKNSINNTLNNTLNNLTK